MRNLAVWTPTVFAPAIALIGSLALAPGCANKTGCLNCHISNVMADPSAPNPSPNSAINVQLEGTRGETVTAVEVTVTNEAGESETHRYEGTDVAGINESSPTSITDVDLYDINGQPPIKGTIEITLSRGSRIEDSLGIEAESAGR